MLEKFVSFLRVPEHTHSMFPGITKCSDSSLIIHCQSGSGFESADAVMYQFRSIDGGKTWQFEGQIPGYAKLDFSEPFSYCSKPAALADGTLLSAGYGARRDKPEMTLSDYSREFGRYPEFYNFLLRSSDNGKTWNNFEWIEHEYAGIENSGPLVQLNDGSLIFTGAPFVLNAPVNRGLVFKSDYSGRNFKEYSCFFEDENIIPFETRSVQFADGTIAIIFWAYDLKNDKNLNNHIVFSGDNGKTWSRAFDSGLAGQAANLFVYKDRLFALQARRSGDAPGLFINEIFIGKDKISTGNDICLWSANGTKGKTGEINQLFESLKFGQPSVLTDDDTCLLVFWSAVSGTYQIEIHGFNIDFLNVNHKE